MSKKVVILGAGIAGLSTAYKLAQNGANVISIEKKPEIGGLAGSVERNGAIFDFGPHTFFLRDDVIEEFYRITDKKEVNVFKTNAKIKFGNRYYYYPLDAIDVLIKSSPLTTFNCLFDYVIAKAKMKANRFIDDSAESWLINRFGRSLYKIYFEKYTEKVKETIAEVVKGIREKEFDPSPGYFACEYCAYRGICSYSKG